MGGKNGCNGVIPGRSRGCAVEKLLEDDMAAGALGTL